MTSTVDPAGLFKLGTGFWASKTFLSAAIGVRDKRSYRDSPFDGCGEGIGDEPAVQPKNENVYGFPGALDRRQDRRCSGVRLNDELHRTASVAYSEPLQPQP